MLIAASVFLTFPLTPQSPNKREIMANINGKNTGTTEGVIPNAKKLSVKRAVKGCKYDSKRKNTELTDKSLLVMKILLLFFSIEMMK